MRRKNWLCVFLAWLLGLCACQTGQEAFIGDRLYALCDETYYICNAPSGCVLDKHHYVEGVFPGTRRVVVETQKVSAKVRARLYFNTMESPGTELLAQLYEKDCTLNSALASAYLKDVDLFEEAGDDRTLYFDLQVAEPGEHLFEIYSDVSAKYTLVIDTQ